MAVSVSGTVNGVMTSAPQVTAPVAPTITAVTAGDGSLSVAFTAGANGGSAITNYKYSTDGTTYTALSPASTTSPFTISGLTNGTSYSVTIKAVNAIGDSVASNAVNGTPVAPASASSSSTTSTTTTSLVTTTTVATTLSDELVVKRKTTPKESLPQTGGDIDLLLVCGALMAVGGLVIASRRRLGQG